MTYWAHKDPDSLSSFWFHPSDGFSSALVIGRMGACDLPSARCEPRLSYVLGEHEKAGFAHRVSGIRHLWMFQCRGAVVISRVHAVETDRINQLHFFELLYLINALKNNRAVLIECMASQLTQNMQ